MTLNSLFSIVLKGGPGSGNKGHAGGIGGKGNPGGSTPQSFGIITKPEMLKHFQDWVKNLTEDERWALDKWQGGSGDYKEIQAYLRTDSKKGSKWKDLANGIQSALVKGELPKNAVLWRAAEIAELNPIHGSSLIGTKFTDKGFTATSIDKKYAEGFAIHPLNPDISYRIKINAKKGTKGAFMDSFKDKEEGEFLMPQGTSFVVTGVDKEYKILEVEIE